MYCTCNCIKYISFQKTKGTSKKGQSSLEVQTNNGYKPWKYSKRGRRKHAWWPPSWNSLFDPRFPRRAIIEAVQAQTDQVFPKACLTSNLLQNNSSKCLIWYCSLGFLFSIVIGWYWSHSFKGNQNYLHCLLTRDIHSAEVRNLPPWNPIVQFYIKRLLTISFNIYNDTCIDPLRGLIVKSRVNYNFRQPANIEVPKLRTEIDRSSFIHRAALLLEPSTQFM